MIVISLNVNTNLHVSYDCPLRYTTNCRTSWMTTTNWWTRQQGEGSRPSSTSVRTQAQSQLTFPPHLNRIGKNVMNQGKTNWKSHSTAPPYGALTVMTLEDKYTYFCIKVQINTLYESHQIEFRKRVHLTCLLLKCTVYIVWVPF
jgi:hypothetical protein